MRQSMKTRNRFGIRYSEVYRIGGVSALLQLVVIALFAVLTAVFGVRPDSTREALELFNSAPLQAFLTGDLFLLVLISLYLGTFPAIYAALKRQAPTAALLALSATLIAVLLGYTNESTFALWHLSKQYAVSGEAERQAVIAAGEAVIASGWWHSTNSYISGFLLQGSGVVISVLMLRSKSFTKWTAWAGLIANGLDLLQHLLEPFTPGINRLFAPVMSPFYLIWFPLLARDFLRLRKTVLQEQKTGTEGSEIASSAEG